MSSAQRRRRDEGRSPRRRAESLGAERHRRGHDERRLLPGLACPAASRKRPSSLVGVYSSRSSSSSRRAYVLTWLVAMMGMGPGRVGAQYVDGGKVSMDCADCSCVGSSDDGTIDVFRSPSDGELVASVEGGYTGVLETTCGALIIAVGDTLYELSGVDFIEREIDVIDMSPNECTGVEIDEPADCYSGGWSSSLDGSIDLTVTICYCKHVDGSATAYRSNVGTQVKGASSIKVPSDELHICFDFEYVSQMAAFEVAGSTHYYDFELAIPGDDTSADLSIESAPPSSAGAFMCGETEPTPSPVEPPTAEPTSPPVPEPTPAPLKPTAPPVDPTTPAPTVATPAPVMPEPTPPPQPPPTPAPAPPPTPSPVAPEPEPTSSPVVPEPDPTSAPVADPTSAPVKPVPVPELTPAPVAPTPEPTAEPTPRPVTPKPTVAPVSPSPTTAPMAPPVASASPAPSVASNTSSPAATVATLGPMALPTAAPVAVPFTDAPMEAEARPTLGPSAAENATTSPAPSTTVGSSSSERTVEGGTAAPVHPADGEGQECELPLDAPCTENPWTGNLNMGIGTFYDPVCNTTSTEEEKEPGCQGDSEVCRLCLFNTVLFRESNPGEDLPNYTVCPCCVLSAYKQETAGDADSSICGTASPAPSVGTTAPSPGALGFADRVAQTQDFQDRRLSTGGSNGVAVAALGLLAVLTFLPVCSK